MLLVRSSQRYMCRIVILSELNAFPCLNKFTRTPLITICSHTRYAIRSSMKTRYLSRGGHSNVLKEIRGSKSTHHVSTTSKFLTFRHIHAVTIHALDQNSPLCKNLFCFRRFFCGSHFIVNENVTNEWCGTPKRETSAQS